MSDFEIIILHIMKQVLVIFFIVVFGSIDAQKDREQEDMKSNLLNEFQPKHHECQRKFKGRASPSLNLIRKNL